jgi:hypothetical protein
VDFFHFFAEERPQGGWRKFGEAPVHADIAEFYVEKTEAFRDAVVDGLKLCEPQRRDDLKVTSHFGCQQRRRWR